MKNCIDCGKQIRNLYAFRCKVCSKKGKLNPNWKKGKPHCKNCGKEIAYERTFCKSCSKLGNRNPMFGKIFSKFPNLRKILMQRCEYVIWRKKVFERDNYTCQICNERGGRLEADHIKPWIDFPQLRYVIENGRTLCIKCHREITKEYLKNNWRNQFYSMGHMRSHK